MEEIKNKFTIDEICVLGEVTKRTLRYYVQENLIDRPEGESKRTAFYTNKHLEQLLTIRKYRNAGISIDGIRELMNEEKEQGIILPSNSRKKGSVEVWSRIYLSEGIELSIDPSQANLSPEQVREFSKTTLDILKIIKERGK